MFDLLSIFGMLFSRANLMVLPLDLDKTKAINVRGEYLLSN